MICVVTSKPIAYATISTCTNSDSCWLRNSYITFRNNSATATTATEIRSATTARTDN
jgi:hypothetical protein